MSNIITEDEWRAELEKLSITQNDEGMTVQELAEVFNLSTKKAQKFVREGVKEGKIRVGQRVVDPDWDGRRRSYIVYRPGEKKV